MDLCAVLAEDKLCSHRVVGGSKDQEVGMAGLARIGGAVASVVVLVVALLGLVPSSPRWLLITLGVIGLIAILVQFFWDRRRREERGHNVRQSQKGGASSRNLQAGRDIRLDGGMGDRRE